MNRNLALIALLCLGACSAPKEPERVLVRTHSGPVAGVVGEGVFAFKGISYASEPWTKNRDGKSFGPDCGDTPDCLTLNVWAPPGKTKTQVIVSDHGNADDIDKVATTYVKSGHVFVSVNTRASQNENDRRAAMNWIKTNIAEFGGDPTHIDPETANE
jgi:para-nitrobenzyl esterase